MEPLLMPEQRISHSPHNLHEIVECTLARSPYFAGRNLRVACERGEVVLTGVVGTYYQKQMAQVSVLAIDGVAGIRNELEVISR